MELHPPPAPVASRPGLDQVDPNVEAVAAVYERIENALTSHQRGIERLVAGLGRPRTLYCCLALAGLWIAANLLAPLVGLVPLDGAPFWWLQGLVTLSSLLLTIVVLIAQNRQGRQLERQAHLDLQVNLLAERKITKIVALLEELRRDSPTIKDRYDGVAEAMERPADPTQVLEAVGRSLDGKR